MFYASFPIQQQAQKGEWDFKLAAVYSIGILDFIFDDADKDDVVHKVQLKDHRNQVFYDKLTFIYLTLPNFKKTLDQLTSLQDKWLYVFRHLPDLEEIPAKWQERVFTKLFHIAELVAMGPKALAAYELSLKYYRDIKNVTDTAFGDRLQLGRQESMELVHEAQAQARQASEQAHQAQEQAQQARAQARQEKLLAVAKFRGDNRRGQ